MPIFISHSHRDKDFVDNLAAHLIKRRAPIWVDRWELRVGDSLIEKIQSAIKTASALVIVLSKASVASAWCTKELNAGLIRELEERRVIVLPVLLEDCDVPMFLRDKKYADFRTDFDKGLEDIYLAAAAITSDTQGRFEKPDFHVDWGIAWGESDGKYALHLRFISHGEKIPFCVLTEVRIICNDALTKKFQEYTRKGVEWRGRLMIVAMLNSAIEKSGSHTIILEDSLDKRREFHFVPVEGQATALDVYISCVRPGADTGMDTWVDWGSHIKQLLEDMSRDVTEADRQKLRAESAR